MLLDCENTYKIWKIKPKEHISCFNKFTFTNDLTPVQILSSLFIWIVLPESEYSPLLRRFTLLQTELLQMAADA